MMENMTREMKYWCIIYTDGTLKTNRIPESITAQDELLDVIYEELVPAEDDCTPIVTDEIVFGPHAVAWLKGDGIVNELPINHLASDLSEMIRKPGVWPHPLRGNVAFINTKIWNTFE